MTAPVGRLASITVDCPDPDRLAAFYAALLDLHEALASPDRSVVGLADDELCLTMMRAKNHAPPTWPDGPQKQQMHLDVAVDDLDAAVSRAIELGARAAETQPRPEVWRVMLDPAGHPFCLTTHTFCLPEQAGPLTSVE